VVFEGPGKCRATVARDYDEDIWGGYYINRGAFIKREHRQAGLHSHVLLAACGTKQVADDGVSFTQALLQQLRKSRLSALSYVNMIESIGRIRNLPKP